jgi:hypothetical protein
MVGGGKAGVVLVPALASLAEVPPSAGVLLRR